MGISKGRTSEEEAGEEALQITTLNLWTVYEKPRDYPEGYVARRSEIRPYGDVVQTSEVLKGSSLEAVRAQLPPGLYRLPRRSEDDPVIVEVWL